MYEETPWARSCFVCDALELINNFVIRNFKSRHQRAAARVWVPINVRVLVIKTRQTSFVKKTTDACLSVFNAVYFHRERVRER